MFLRKPAFYKGFHIYFPEGGMKIDESDKIMLVKPLHVYFVKSVFRV